MKTILLAGTVLAFMGGAANALPAITGDINFEGSNSYNSTSVTFIGLQGVTSGTGTLATFGTCTSCITAKDLTYNPYSGSLPSFLNGTNNGETFNLDLGAITNVSFIPGSDLDFNGNATLSLTGYQTTPGVLFFSTQGPNNIEVSFSATGLPVAEPGTMAVLGVALAGLGIMARKRRA